MNAKKGYIIKTATAIINNIYNYHKIIILKSSAISIILLSPFIAIFLIYQKFPFD